MSQRLPITVREKLLLSQCLHAYGLSYSSILPIIRSHPIIAQERNARHDPTGQLWNESFLKVMVPKLLEEVGYQYDLLGEQDLRAKSKPWVLLARHWYAMRMEELKVQIRVEELNFENAVKKMDAIRCGKNDEAIKNELIRRNALVSVATASTNIPPTVPPVTSTSNPNSTLIKQQQQHQQHQQTQNQIQRLQNSQTQKSSPDMVEIPHPPTVVTTTATVTNGPSQKSQPSSSQPSSQPLSQNSSQTHSQSQPQPQPSVQAQPSSSNLPNPTSNQARKTVKKDTKTQPSSSTSKNEKEKEKEREKERENSVSAVAVTPGQSVVSGIDSPANTEEVDDGSPNVGFSKKVARRTVGPKGHRKRKAATATEEGGNEQQPAKKPKLDDSLSPMPGSSTSANPTPTNPVDQIFQRTALSVLSALLLPTCSQIFHVPVKKTEAPNYYQVIHRPTDLRSIAKKVREGGIGGVQELRKELLLMTANSVMFNRRETEFMRDALEMTREIEKAMETFSRSTEGQRN